jgi:hypothetical protein
MLLLLELKAQLVVEIFLAQMEALVHFLILVEIWQVMVEVEELVTILDVGAEQGGLLLYLLLVVLLLMVEMEEMGISYLQRLLLLMELVVRVVLVVVVGVVLKRLVVMLVVWVLVEQKEERVVQLDNQQAQIHMVLEVEELAVHQVQVNSLMLVMVLMEL